MRILISITVNKIKMRINKVKPTPILKTTNINLVNKMKMINIKTCRIKDIIVSEMLIIIVSEMLMMKPHSKKSLY